MDEKQFAAVHNFQEYTTMKPLTRLLIVAIVSLTVLAGMALAGSWLVEQASAQTVDPVEVRERTISVSGQGQIMIEPDVAFVQVGVQSEGTTAVDAMAENNERMQAVISATLATGVDDEDVRTTVLRLNPVYDTRPNTAVTPTAAPIGYRATNMVQITVRDLEDLGDLLDAVVAAGGTTIENIHFDVSDINDALNQARAAAMNDARQKAELLVSLADARLGEVMSITEFTDRPLSPGRADLFVEEAVTAVPIQRGLERVEANVFVVWRIR
jgi:uncharacterized protein